MMIAMEAADVSALHSKIHDLTAERDRFAAELAEIRAQEPVDYQYLFGSPFGGDVWRDSASQWNGNKPKASRALYAAPVSQKNEWKEAVLEELAAHALDVHVDAPPRVILSEIISMSQKMARDPAINDPMDWPLPCDVTVGHGTMRKRVALRTLVLRMKVLYEMVTGRNADEVAGRSVEYRKAMSFDQWWDTTANTPAPDTFKRWEESCRQAWCAGAASVSKMTPSVAENAVSVSETPTPVADGREIVASLAKHLLEAADLFGLVVTIERRPLQPLAMGNTEPVVTVWGKLGKR